MKKFKSIEEKYNYFLSFSKKMPFDLRVKCSGPCHEMKHQSAFYFNKEWGHNDSVCMACRRRANNWKRRKHAPKS